MTFDEYQKESRKTVVDPDRDNLLISWTLGIVGEAGEVAEHMKKALRDDGGKVSEERRMKLKKELGDVLWYMAQFATELGFSFDEIAALNIEKLSSRKERGVLQGSGDER